MLVASMSIYPLERILSAAPNELQSQLDECRNDVDSVEFWFARDLQEYLGYARWESFEKVVLKAAENARLVNVAVDDHFRQVTKMVKLGSGSERNVSDYALSRYGAYLVAINADASKPNVAFIKNYFIVQAQAREDVERRILDEERLEGRGQLKASEKVLSSLFTQRGLDSKDIAVARSKGDSALFGGESTAQLKKRFGVSDSRPLADFLPTLTIAAKNLINEMTKLNIEESAVRGAARVTSEHMQNSASMRDMLAQRGIRPEELPAEEDIRKVERRLARDEKKLITNTLPALEE